MCPPAIACLHCFVTTDLLFVSLSQYSLASSLLSTMTSKTSNARLHLGWGLPLPTVASVVLCGRGHDGAAVTTPADWPPLAQESEVPLWQAHGQLAKYGLATKGKEQATRAGIEFRQAVEASGFSDADVRIFASPFSRTEQTAAIVASALGWQSGDSRLKSAAELRERYFGPALEGKSHHLYKEVWVSDARDPGAPPQGGESVEDVSQRVLAFLRQVEAAHERSAILFVSHGDTLQILQASLWGGGLMEVPDDGCTPHHVGLRKSAVPSPPLMASLAAHRRFGLETGELRPMQ